MAQTRSTPNEGAARSFFDRNQSADEKTHLLLTASQGLYPNVERGMDSKRKLEVFSAGCALCHEVIDVVRREAGSSFQIIVHNMMDARVLNRSLAFDPFRQS
jgi:hypothetical protein